MNEPPMIIAARAEQAMREGRLIEAVADLSKLKTIVPEDPMVHLMWAFAHRAQSDIEQAKAGFGKALELSPNDIGIRGQYASWLGDIGEYDDAVAHYDFILKLQPTHLDAQIDRALAMAKSQKRAEGINSLRTIAKLNPGALRAWSNLAILLREDQDYESAKRAAEHILTRDANHVRAHHIIAQCAYEQGQPSATLFKKAQKKAPEDLRIVSGLSAALIREGNGAKAIALLSDTVAKNPGWTAGHNILSEYRWQFDGSEDFARSFKDALSQDSSENALWSDYIVMTSRALGHEAALSLIDEARASSADEHMLDMLEANSRGVLGELAAADRLFAKCDVESSPEALLYYVLFLTKAQRFDDSAEYAMKLVDMGRGGDAWPFVSIAWRMLEDPRWEWLEGNEAFVQTFDLDGFDAEIPKLAAKLREMHQFKVRPVGQSLRGGTQTEAALFSDQSPVIQSLVRHLRKAVGRYIESMPPHDPDHPLLGLPRDKFRFTGSWSVRLTNAGFHVNHIHNQGNISSAFYVSLPENMGDGQKGAHEGWLAIGEPAAEFDTGLPPVRMIEPKPGRLALFPSTMWHGTRPFGDGERLTCAFDVGLLGV